MKKATRWLASYAIFAALVAECLVLSLATDAFFTESNLANVVRQNGSRGVLLTLLKNGNASTIDSLIVRWPSGIVQAKQPPSTILARSTTE